MIEPPRVLLSYAHTPDGAAHAQLVQQFWMFLRTTCGIDARLDIPAADQPQDWSLWMADEIRAADHVLIIASAAYRERAEERGDPSIGRGVRWEARLIRDAFYADQHRLDRFLPVVLPGQSKDGVPDFLAPNTSTVYYVKNFTVEGMEPLFRVLTRQPGTIVPPLGVVPVLEPREPPPVNLPPSPKPHPRKPANRRGSTVNNTFNGNANGLVIQAGSIGGGINPGGALGPGYGDEDDY